MQYGYFDDAAKEYVITRPDTPKSWSNYLGSTIYGAIITNNAGGYSFYRSGGMGRFMRLRFNSVPMDQPGRYLYLRDRQSGDFWSGSWQPVGKPLESYHSTCRHGTAYTIITSTYLDISVETTYYVPLNQDYEVWRVKITNTGKRARDLQGFTYVEYASNWNAIDDLLNLQYVQYTARMKVTDGIIEHGTNVNIPEMPEDFKEKDQGRFTFQALAGADPSGYETDREAFLGPYRTYANPVAVEEGKTGQSLGYGDNVCGSLAVELPLEAGQTKEFCVLIGIGAADHGSKIRAKYSEKSQVENDLEELKNWWHSRMGDFEVQSPDHQVNSTANVWGIYNSLITFNWSRAASLIYSGIDRDGLGYRDSVQDILGVAHAVPQEARERLELLITGQVSNGGAMPVIVPFSHRPGHEQMPAAENFRSDDCLWLFNAIPAWVKETGKIDFYRKVLPYADDGEDTVFQHLRRAIEFNLERAGSHGLPAGLAADWNDCLRFGYNGESVFVAMQLRFALKTYREIAELLEEPTEADWAGKELQILDKSIQEHAWDGKWFMRGYRYDGLKFGSGQNPEGKIFFNPQTWSVISGVASHDQALEAMKCVEEMLATDYGVRICDPPYEQGDHHIVRAQLMNPGLKENGGIFNHTQGWGVIAECILGNGNQAYKYLRSYLPAAFNERAEIREIEPYVVCQSTHAPQSPKYGASRVPWLSGAATWTYYAISQYLFGVRPEYHGVTIDPCIPAEWEGFTIQRTFRGKQLKIDVRNPDHNQKGVKKLEINGEVLPGSFIPVSKLHAENQIIVIL